MDALLKARFLLDAWNFSGICQDLAALKVKLKSMGISKLRGHPCFSWNGPKPESKLKLCDPSVLETRATRHPQSRLWSVWFPTSAPLNGSQQVCEDGLSGEFIWLAAGKTQFLSGFNVDPLLIHPSLMIGVFPSKSEQSPLKPGTPAY